jgi:hypothetical protein
MFITAPHASFDVLANPQDAPIANPASLPHSFEINAPARNSFVVSARSPKLVKLSI